MKKITKEEIDLLLENNVIKNTTRGFVGQETNYTIGFYRTRHNRYMEDKYVDIARNLCRSNISGQKQAV